MRLDAENQGLLIEILKNVVTLKTLSAVDDFWEELEEKFERLAGLKQETMRFGIINQTFSDFIISVGGLVLLWYGSRLVIAGDIRTLGQLLAFISMNRNFTGFIEAAIELIDEIARLKLSIQRIEEVTQSKLEIDSNKTIAPSYSNESADIIFHKVAYEHYSLDKPSSSQPKDSDTFSLAIDELCIPGGISTAIIGPSGCGKSTLVKLMLGLYSPKSGRINLGDYTLQDLSPDYVRQQIALVSQEAQFWSRSISDNFLLGNRSVTQADMVNACRLTGAHQFIEKLPNRYETVLGEFAVNLSGGQRQRLAIARSIARHPSVLVLDESTSALDAPSENQLLDRLLSARKGKTTILISHRQQVVDKADHILSLA